MSKLISMTVAARALMMIVAASLIGCGKEKPTPIEKDPPTHLSKAGSDSKKKSDATKPKRPPVLEVLPPVAQVPPVVMSQQHLDRIKVFQNDAISENILDGELLGLDGKMHT